MSDEMRRQVETDEQIDIAERAKLRELNEQIDQQNVQRRAHGQPALPAVTTLTEEQRTTIRTQVDEHFHQQDLERQRTQAARGGAGTVGAGGAAAATGGATTGAHPATGTGTGTGTGSTQPTDEGRPATWRRFGEQVGVGLSAAVAGFWGISLPEEHHAAAAGATTTPGAHTGPQAPNAAAAHAHAGTPGAHGADGTHAAVAAGTAVGTTHAAGAAGAAHPAAHHAGHFGDLDDQDVEELIRRVYPRLRTSLRNELLTDRERAGMLADFR
jgi:hypothetical protein